MRFIAIELIDVAGLVPDAHLGKGLGNEFLDALRVAEAVIHVLDASGGTDAEGNPVGTGNYDPVSDVKFLEYEISMWLNGILKRNWDKLMRNYKGIGGKPEQVLIDQMAGAGVSDNHIRRALTEMKKDLGSWNDEDVKRFAALLREYSKPMILAANKMDVAPPENVQKLLALKEELVIPVSGAAEIALRMAEKAGLISYKPGDPDFVVKGQLSPAQTAGLEKIRALMKQYGGTGVQQCINRAIFELLDYIVLYPVEDEGKFTDRKGVILPGCLPHEAGQHGPGSGLSGALRYWRELPLCHRRQDQDAPGREARAEGRGCDKDSLDEVKKSGETISTLFLVFQHFFAFKIGLKMGRRGRYRS